MAGDIDEDDGDGDAKWRAKHQKEFEKERKEHPTFTDQQVWQVVRDHAKEKKMMDVGIDFQVFVPLTKSVEGVDPSEAVSSSAPAAAPEDDGDWFAGIASTSDLDRDGDVVTEKALAKGALDLMRNSTVFFNHKHDGLGVGKINKAWIDGNMLKIKFSPSKAAGVQDVVTQMKEGILRSLSIGGKVRHYDMRWNEAVQKDVRMIDDIDFYEVSVVGIPANPNATLSSHIAKAFHARTAHVAVSEDAGKGGGDSMDKDDKEATGSPLAAPALEKKQEPPKSKEQEDKEKKEKEDKEKKEKEACSSSVKKEEDSKCEVQTPSQPALPPVVVKTAEPEPTVEQKSLREELDEVKKDLASMRSVKKGLVVNENPADEAQAPATSPVNEREASFKKMVEDNLAIL